MRGKSVLTGRLSDRSAWGRGILGCRRSRGELIGNACANTACYLSTGYSAAQQSRPAAHPLDTEIRTIQVRNISEGRECTQIYSRSVRATDIEVRRKCLLHRHSCFHTLLSRKIEAVHWASNLNASSYRRKPVSSDLGHQPRLRKGTGPRLSPG